MDVVLKSCNKQHHRMNDKNESINNERDQTTEIISPLEKHMQLAMCVYLMESACVKKKVHFGMFSEHTNRTEQMT
jgi:hypothetical protein